MVMESHYLDSLEREQEANIPMGNMITLEEHNKQIQELRDTIKNLNGIISTMRMTMDSLRASNDKNTEQMSKMQLVIESLTQELRKYQDRNNRHNKERYGSTSQKRRDEKSSKKSRQEESDDYDNSHSENDTNDSSSENSASSSDTIVNTEKIHSEHLPGVRGPRGIYNTMDAAVVETLETSLEHFPKDAKFRGYKTVDEYSKVSYIKCIRYIIAICEDKYGNRHDYYESQNAEDSRIPNRDVIPGTSFLPSLGADLVLDRYDVMIPNHREAKRMKVDRFSCCHNTRLNAMKAMAALLEPIYTKMKEMFHDVTETLMRLRKRARNMLADKHAHYSDLMIRALNYMLNGWDDLIRYREDGRYTIDNMEAERSIRPFVVSRKGSMFFSSEAGVKVAMIFHTIIETAKMWGQEVKGYLSYVMSKLIHNENDYEKLLPSEISL